NHLVVDAYNANPSSMKAALDNFHLMEVSPKMAILGDMRELGEASAEEHQKAVDLMQEYGFENIWLVGDEFGNTQCNYRKFKDVEEVKAAIIAEDIKGYNILIKGSNSTKLWQLPPLL
ncbi:MAG: UDP-N-acetylmuramoyl-tripeptide--D-alanyl-D-alanine ligase, partial [Prevotella sp.]|nr:UDP-N-acetylmuramoyl-tripeptide--D-alanyl-D-alanine ligase [Prevotella sp.]